jgi:Na+-transporting methylmalonyl-CoA/oxaloacetate decarboxylase gamma subunit
LKTFITSSVLLLLLTGCYGALQNQIDEMKGDTERAEEAAAQAAQAADEAAVAAVEAAEAAEAEKEKSERIFERDLGKK